jgi:predicted ATPase
MRIDSSLLDSFTTFGDLLKYLRVRANLTQRELSIAVDYSEAQISRQESNKRVPSEFVLKALFIPALGLEHEPDTVSRLLNLAAKARDVDRFMEVSVAGEEVSPQRISQPACHNLPRQISSFIGREKEVEQVVKMIREHPLVTLTGAGGVGKTRLALRAAANLVNAFPDGVWLVELAPVIDPVFVPIAVGSVFKVHSTPGYRLVQTLREFFAAKCLLLIFDNCEHVIDAVAELCTSLLEGCPKLSILATSREILNVEGEYFFRCPSLSLPDAFPNHLSTPILKRVEASEAVRLFIERAAAASPGFALSEKNAAAITKICLHLDGIPLAIELAAARLRLLSLDQIVDNIGNVFGLLSGNRRSVQPRHKTLKALIDWSYQLLSPGEQILLRRLSVFAGGWTLPAAESVAVGDGVEPGEVLDRMQQLVDKSLIFVETTELEENRYHMLETIRQYAGEKIQEAGEYCVTRDRHLAFFAHTAELADPLNPNHILSLCDAQRMMQDLDNVRLALAWSLETDVEPGLWICLTFSNVVPIHLYYEIGDWLERLLEAEAARSDSPGSQRGNSQINFLRGSALMCVGESSYLWGQRSRSEQALLESIAIFEAIGDPAVYSKACAQMHLGTLLICTDPEQSRVYLESSRDTFQRMDIKPTISSCDRMMAALYLLTGDIIQARKSIEEDLQLCKALWGIEFPPTLDYAGCLELQKGNYDRAIAVFHQGMESGIQIKSLHQAAYLGWMEGCAALAQGSIEHLLRLHEYMLCLGQETGSDGWFFNADALLAMLEWTQGEYAQAAKRSQEGLEKYYPANLCYTLPFPYVLGRIALARGDQPLAERYFRQVDDMANAPPVWRWKPVSLHAFGLLAAAQSSQRDDMAERAANLFGAQEKLFGWLPNFLSPFERDEYVKALTRLKETLGKEAFLTAWARGQVMSHQQAFTLALTGTGIDRF